MSKSKILGTWMTLIELLMRKKTKLQIVVFFFKKKGENVQGKKKSAGARFLIFLERERAHSL